MNTSEIFDPIRRKKRVVENFLNSQYGIKLAATGDKVKIHSLITKLQEENTRLSSKTANFENNKDYVKNSMIIEALRTMLSEIAPMRTKRRVNEAEGDGDLAQAELILVAKDMVNQLQKMAEDVAEMQTDDLMALEEKIKTTFGQEQGNQFAQGVDGALGTLLDQVKAAKDALSSAIGVLSGEAPMGGDMMGGDMMGAAGEMEPSLEPAPEGDFAGADAMAGAEEEPTGRELK
jgi:hypothetical protein